MNPGEEATARQGVEPRVRMPSGNKDPLSSSGIIFPFNGDPMGGILAGDPLQARQVFRTNLFQADQADSGNSESLHQLGPEVGGQDGFHHIWGNPVVEQNPAPDDSAEGGDGHLETKDD